MKQAVTVYLRQSAFEISVSCLKILKVSMKALIFRETGEPKSVLKLAEIPTPELAPGEALVRVL